MLKWVNIPRQLELLFQLATKVTYLSYSFFIFLVGISVDVHITPYQIKDERRPWLRREEKIFSGQLQKFGAIVRRVVHFEEETPTLDNHFRILKDF